MKKFNLSDLVLFENNDYLIIDKPAGISTLSDRKEEIHLLKLIREFWPGAITGHRLDKDTSGVLAVAKNEESYRWLSIQFEHRKVEKFYHALVCGMPAYSNTEVNAPIEKKDDGTVRISKRGKQAQTFFTTLDHFTKHSLVEARPVTGRTHQIRIHLSLLGTPILGDVLYGGEQLFLSSIKRGYKPGKGQEERPVSEKMALHSKKLRFLDQNGHPIMAEAPYPKDFKALLNQLTRNRS
ncbi:MAG: RNA pseudouridine synthase [Bacteroidetes bacterium]|nr:RNA pseudouridine synthase [Bacteroidota bacterium]